MKTNMGKLDRAIRFLIGVLIGVLYLAGVVKGVIAIGLIVLAVVFILTSFVGTCPLYIPLGINTCKQKP